MVVMYLLGFIYLCVTVKVEYNWGGWVFMVWANIMFLVILLLGLGCRIGWRLCDQSAMIRLFVSY